VFIGFSTYPYSRITLGVARNAQRHGALIIAITDSGAAVSPMAVRPSVAAAFAGGRAATRDAAGSAVVARQRFQMLKDVVAGIGPISWA
jgi:DNA-binding MurR/RpiR family transcriptional regulator